MPEFQRPLETFSEKSFSFLLNSSSALRMRMRFNPFSPTSCCRSASRWFFFSRNEKKKLKGPKERRKQQQEEKKAKSQINFFFLFFWGGFYLLVFAVVVDAIGGNTHSSFLNGRSSSQPIRLTSWLRFPPNRLSESLLSKGEEWWTDWEKEPGKKGRKESKPKWINKEEEKKKKRNERNSSWKQAGGGYGDNVPIQSRALSSFDFLFYLQCSSIHPHTHTQLFCEDCMVCVCVLVHSRAKGELLKYQDKACPQLDPFILLLLWLPLKKRERCSCCWCCLPISPSLSRYVSLFLVFVSWPSPSHWPRNERQPQQLLTSLNR